MVCDWRCRTSHKLDDSLVRTGEGSRRAFDRRSLLKRNTRGESRTEPLGFSTLRGSEISVLVCAQRERKRIRRVSAFSEMLQRIWEPLS